MADALRAESTAKAEQTSQPQLGSPFETMGDYLPLPISQRYPKSGGGGIRMDEGGTEREGEDEVEAGPGEDAGDGEGEACEAWKQISGANSRLWVHSVSQSRLEIVLLLQSSAFIAVIGSMLGCSSFRNL